MQLKVRKVNQMASGGSYVVIYDADVEMLHEPGTIVDVISTDPSDCAPELIELARLAILRGAERALAPGGLSASIHVLHLVISPSDFQPRRFEAFTAIELEQLIVNRSLAPMPRDGT